MTSAQETINIKLSDIDENGNVTLNLKLNIEQVPVVVEPPEEPAPEPEPEEPEPVEPTPPPSEFLFPDDWELPLVQSIPTDIKIPKGIENLFDVKYLGAFRVDATGGDSSSNYANGAIGFNPVNKSLYLAGRATDGAITEVKIPSSFSMSEDNLELSGVEVLQPYSTVVLTSTKQHNDMRVTGMLWYEGSLLVTSNVWYDAASSNKRHLQVFDADNIAAGSSGYLSVDGDAKAAGYMSKIPDNLADEFKATHLMGWATNYSITNRYSQGPSLYTFNPDQAINASENVPNTPRVAYPYTDDGSKNLVQRDEYYDDVSQPREAMWSNSKAFYSFFVPDSPYLLVAGYSTGINSGIGYKITQTNGNVCGGGCPFDSDDVYNYFWIYHKDDILSASEPHKVKPISYGKWSHPFDRLGKSPVRGGAYDAEDNILYLTIDKAGKVNTNYMPPLVIAYKIKVKRT